MIKIIFECADIVEAHRVIDAVRGTSTVSFDKPAQPEAEEQLQKPRRRRRSKAEMEEARAAEEDAAAEELIVGDYEVDPPAQKEEDEKPTRRRRRRPGVGSGEDQTSSGDVQSNSGAVEKPVRRRQAVREDESTPQAGRTNRRRRASRSAEGTEGTGDGKDEITDRDVAKAASEGAQELTPAAVRGILDQFSESNVADLDQGQRREFIDLIDDAIKDAADERGC